jgi:4-hydroxybenzoate polyprenyltransferase
MVLCLTALIGLASTGGSPAWGRLALVLVAMLFSQLAIGWTNDYVDRVADARHQPYKPVPAGLVPAGLVPAGLLIIGSKGALIVSLIAGILLGPAPLAFLIAGTAAGLAYNFWLKNTRLSALAFVVAFAVLLPFAWTGLDAFRDRYLMLYPIAIPLTLAVHLANTLPDLPADRGAARRNLSVALGRTRSLVLLAVSVLLPPALALVAALWLQYDALPLGAGSAVYGMLLALAAIFYAAGTRDAEVWAFRAVAVGAIVFVFAWLAAV